MITLKKKPLDAVRNEPNMMEMLEQSITELEIRDAEKELLICELQKEIDRLTGKSTETGV